MSLEPYPSMTYSGTCQEMCPENERNMRLTHSQMSIFEVNRNVMVKEYRRSGADQEEPAPEDLRTPRALSMTISYLAFNIMDDMRSKSEDLALEWYDFLWDRLRAVRKDITQQKICDQESVAIVERCARFHVHSCYAMNRVKDFDVHLNRRNLNDCLQMLRQMYTDLRDIGIRCPSEPEFQVYDVLLHLDEDYSSTIVLIKTSDHRSSEKMRRITRILNAYSTNDYFKFFQLMKCADYMESCILSLYANKMRLSGLRTITATCASRQNVWYPVEPIIKSLGFDDLEDLSYFASVFNIDLQQKAGGQSLLLDKQLLAVIRQQEQNLPQLKSKQLVENKMENKSVGRLVYGTEIEESSDCMMATEPIEESENTYMIEDESGTSSCSSQLDRSKNSSVLSSPPTEMPIFSNTLLQPPTPSLDLPQFTKKISAEKIPQPVEHSQSNVKPAMRNFEWTWTTPKQTELHSLPVYNPKVVQDELQKLDNVVAEIKPPAIPIAAIVGQSPPSPVPSQVSSSTEVTDHVQDLPPPTDEFDEDEMDDDSDESDRLPQFKPILRTRVELADLMPVGKFRTKFKRPTLKMPVEEVGKLEVEQKKPRSQVQEKTIESLREQIYDEVRANSTLLQIISNIFS